MPTSENYNGIFLPTDNQFAGHLKIAGADSILKLVGKTFCQSTEAEDLDIHGILNNGKKASLLKCVLYSKTQHRFDDNSQSESVFFPNYVIVGEEYLRSDEPVIQKIHYHFENVHCLLSGHKIFQSLSPDTEETLHILESEHKRAEKAAEKYGWSKRPFKPQISDHPQLLYFSGLWEIISSDSKVGKVSLTNRTNCTMRSAAGIGIKNEITANIEFKEPKTLDTAIDALRSLHSLFELNLGRRQRLCWIELELVYRSKESAHDMPQKAQLYWSLCNERVRNESKTSLNDVLISPEQHPEEFAKVVTCWMNSMDIMGDPRGRFGTAFSGNYGIDRIVGAANMFDLLPETHAPRAKEVDASLKEAVMQCRKTFKDLPNSFAKQSILSALGRIGRASLRDKVYFRADKVIAAAGGKFQELHLPCHHAVLARNHYVHGSNGAFNYQNHFTQFAFIIDTLEFVFAASDLLDLGWDLKRWMNEGTSMTHPFGAYIVNYSQNIEHLKTIVDK